MSVKELVILSWNCRGINNAITRDSVKSCYRKSKANMICLQETKCSQWNNMLGSQLGSLDDHGWIIQNSLGLSKGLVCFWNKSLFKCVSFAQAQHWIWGQFICNDSQEIFHLINIYSPLGLREKKELWSELALFCRISSGEPICLVGDFNCIRSESERINL